MLLCRDFVELAVQTNQKYSRDNNKVSTFLHSHMFIALDCFLLIWTSI